MGSINDRAKKYIYDNYDLPLSKTPHALMGYKDGAYEQREVDIERAWQWMRRNIIVGNKEEHYRNFIKAMKDEND